MTRMHKEAVAAVLLFASALLGCGASDRGGGPPPAADKKLPPTIAKPEEEGGKMQLKSSFQHGTPIAAKHTGDGADLSPTLSWTGVPDGAKTFALICDDPDAPSPRKPNKDPWVHWVIYNIPGDCAELPEGRPRDAKLADPAGARQGVNSWSPSGVGYRGPYPPSGSGVHRYFFRLYALDSELDLDPNQTTKEALLRAMQGRILGQGELMGTYQRK